MARTLKLYKLPDQPVTPGLRQMQPKDVPQVGWVGAKKYFEQAASECTGAASVGRAAALLLILQLPSCSACESPCVLLPVGQLDHCSAGAGCA